MRTLVWFGGWERFKALVISIVAEEATMQSTMSGLGTIAAETKLNAN